MTFILSYVQTINIILYGSNGPYGCAYHYRIHVQTIGFKWNIWVKPIWQTNAFKWNIWVKPIWQTNAFKWNIWVRPLH